MTRSVEYPWDIVTESKWRTSSLEQKNLRLLERTCGNLNCNNYNRSKAGERNSKPGAKIGKEENDPLNTNEKFYCPHLIFLPFLRFYFRKQRYFCF